MSCFPSLSASDTHWVCYSSCQWGVHGARKGGAVGESDLPNAAVWVGTAAQASRGTWKGSYITLATNSPSAYILKLFFSLFFLFPFPFLLHSPSFSLFYHPVFLPSSLSLSEALKCQAGCRGKWSISSPNDRAWLNLFPLLHCVYEISPNYF